MYFLFIYYISGTYDRRRKVPEELHRREPNKRIYRKCISKTIKQELYQVLLVNSNIGEGP